MPNTFERTRRTGLLHLDRDQVHPGYVCYAPIYSEGEVYLLDLEGNAVHRWDTGYPAGLWGYLLPNGNLFYGGQDPDQGEQGRFGAWQLFRGGVMLEINPQGKVVWEHHDDHHHHDARRTDAGGAIYLTVEPMSAELAAQVPGGVADGDATMWADVIVEVDANGNRVWEWHVLDHLEPASYPLTFNDARHEWSHGNTVVPVPGQGAAGDKVLASFRNISTVLLIDKASGQIDWELGPSLLAQQHDPNLLDNGHLLVFDNGCHRLNSPLSFSRVLEIDPATEKIEWVYQDLPLVDFFSPFISGARRLANGNTLITEGCAGRMFQVTATGEVVWEYVNPHVGPDPMGLYLIGRNAVFRASHYAASEIPWL